MEKLRPILKFCVQLPTNVSDFLQEAFECLFVGTETGHENGAPTNGHVTLRVAYKPISTGSAFVPVPKGQVCWGALYLKKRQIHIIRELLVYIFIRKIKFCCIFSNLICKMLPLVSSERSVTQPLTLTKAIWLGNVQN